MKKNYNSPKIKVAKSTLNVKYMDMSCQFDSSVSAKYSTKVKETSSQDTYSSNNSAGATFW